MRLAIVTATLDPARSLGCRMSWRQQATQQVSTYTVYNGAAQVPEPVDVWESLDLLGGTHRIYYTREILGVVPAFALGVAKALEDGAEVIACFHDDLEILDPSWDQRVLGFFDASPKVGLAGFGGGTGLGADDLYKTPYQPMQLARIDFVSNMVDAENHGRRAHTSPDFSWGYMAPERVACLDGFSQIGRREFWLGGYEYEEPQNLFTLMQRWGVIHHFYDGMLGCFAKRLGWEAWMLPIRCRHYGGQTAVGDARYKLWADQQVAALARTDAQNDGPVPDGDQSFWLRAHQIGYEQFRDVLPIRL